MKRIFAFIFAFGMIFSMASCAKAASTEETGTAADTNAAVKTDISGKTFVWEKEGAGGDFTITLNSDGTYEYYEGYFSSYIGMGNWELENNILTMTESSGYDFVFRFSVEDGNLRYNADGSDQFMYAQVADGDRFLPGEAEPELTPAGCVDRLFASGDVSLTLNLAGAGAQRFYPANDWYAGRLKVLLVGYSWTKLQMPSTEPSTYWLTAVSADGAERMTFWSDSDAGMVQYSDGNASYFWSAVPAEEQNESIAKDVRMEYDNLDVDTARISFAVEGSAEDAADYFVHSAYGEHMATLAPGNMYGFSEYEVLQWEAREVSEAGDAVVGSFEYAFVPWDINSPGIWAGNTGEGTGEYEGKLTCYREFVLQQQEDGRWHCIGLGTGGYSLPE